MRLAITAAAVLAITASASATVRKVPQDYANIQAAEDACVDGDTILVSKGRYVLATPVNIDVANIVVVGKGAIVDCATPGGNNNNINGFEVYAAGVTITGFRFVNGFNQIYSEGANLIVRKCTFVDPDDSCMNLDSGSGPIVEGCKFLGTEDAAIEAYVSNVRFMKNVLRSADDYGFRVTGAGARFEGNTLNFIGDDEAIVNDSANNAVALKNKIFVTGTNGIDFTGNDVTIEGNTIAECAFDVGIEVDGSSAFVSKNRISRSYAGIYVQNGDGGEVLGNKVAGVYGNWVGVEVEADNMKVVGNSVVLGSGYSYGFYLYSRTVAGTGLIESNSTAEMSDSGFYLGSNAGQPLNGVEVRNCTAKNCGVWDAYGFFIDYANNSTFEGLKVTNQDNTGIWTQNGNDNVFTKCSVSGVYGDGFRVQSGDNNDFIDCTAAKCGGEGFDNRGGSSALLATELIGGKYRGDRNDVANDTIGGAFISLTDVNKVTPGTPQSQVD